MPFSQELPKWLKTGTKPPDTILNTDGWKAGDKPPADWLNWIQNRSHEVLKELQQNAIHNDQKGVANGLATLGTDGILVASQRPPIPTVNDGTTVLKGIVMLEDSTTSVSTTKAATPNSVKIAMDKANAAFTSANNGKAIVRTAIIGKGGTVADADADGVPTHQELADGVNTIQRGQGNAVESQVLFGISFSNADGILRSGSMPNISSDTPSQNVNGTITGGRLYMQVPQGYWNGVYFNYFDDPDFIPSNIRSGVNIFGLTGSLMEGKQWASGNVGNLVGSFSRQITGLAFNPMTVIVTVDEANTNFNKSAYATRDSQVVQVDQLDGIHAGQNNANGDLHITLGTNSFWISGNPIPSYESTFYNVKWLAIG
jgi:hypothetical protein